MWIRNIEPRIGKQRVLARYSRAAAEPWCRAQALHAGEKIDAALQLLYLLHLLIDFIVVSFPHSASVTSAEAQRARLLPGHRVGSTSPLRGLHEVAGALSLALAPGRLHERVPQVTRGFEFLVAARSRSLALLAESDSAIFDSFGLREGGLATCTEFAGVLRLGADFIPVEGVAGRAGPRRREPVGGAYVVPILVLAAPAQFLGLPSEGTLCCFCLAGLLHLAHDDRPMMRELASGPAAPLVERHVHLQLRPASRLRQARRRFLLRDGQILDRDDGRGVHTCEVRLRITYIPDLPLESQNVRVQVRLRRLQVRHVRPVVHSKPRRRLSLMPREGILGALMLQKSCPLRVVGV